MSDLPPPPNGYTLIPQPPPGYALVDALPQEKPTGGDAVAANAITGLQNGVGNLLGTPHVVGAMADKIGDYFLQGGLKLRAMDGDIPAPPDSAPVNTGPGWLTQHTYSPEDINGGLYAASAATNRLLGLPAPVPYKPETPAGQFGQDLLGAVVPSLIGGGGLSALAGREAAGLSGTGAADLYGQAHPGDTVGQLAVGVLGAAAGGGGAALAGNLGARVARPFFPNGPASRNVAGELATASGMSGQDIENSVDQNLPNWTPGTRPTLANVTENDGLRNLEYGDQAAAARSGDTTYQTNSRLTNAAQRQAVDAVTPDTTQTLADLTTARDQSIAAIPQGGTAQETGRTLRQNMQTQADQLRATRSAGGTAFDALENIDTPISLRPVMDFATTQAAKNAGVVGQAYQQALSQFRSPTGLVLDTAPFANSVLKGLGDLAGSYPAGSAGARAVSEVKSRLENSLTAQVPEIGAARAQWATNSRPLDVFDAKPFAQILQTDRFGRQYAMPNDSVVSSFLRGNGSADSLDKLNAVFSDPAAAARGLQDYIAGQVRQNAIRPDGSIDTVALAQTLKPFQPALMRFGGLRNQFSTAEGAQAALDQQLAYQRLYDRFSTGLGTMEQDAAGRPMFSPSQFDNAVKASGPLLVEAYGPQGAATIQRVNNELSNIAQTPYAKVKGQSGTGQVLSPAGGAKGGWLGSMAGSIAGTILEHLAGESSAAGAIIGGKIGEAATHLFGQGNDAVAAAAQAIRRQALTDPVYARNLMVKYHPGFATAAGQRAFDYVIQRTPGLAATQMLSPPPNSPGMSYSVAPQ